MTFLCPQYLVTDNDYYGDYDYYGLLWFTMVYYDYYGLL